LFVLVSCLMTRRLVTFLGDNQLLAYTRVNFNTTSSSRGCRFPEMEGKQPNPPQGPDATKEPNRLSLIKGCEWEEHWSKSNKTWYYWQKGVHKRKQHRDPCAKPHGFEDGVIKEPIDCGGAGGAASRGTHQPVSGAGGGAATKSVGAKPDPKEEVVEMNAGRRLLCDSGGGGSPGERHSRHTAEQGNSYVKMFADPHKACPLPAIAEIMHNSVDAGATKIIITKASAAFTSPFSARDLYASSAKPFVLPLLSPLC
jgi:hypothetical protein